MQDPEPSVDLSRLVFECRQIEHAHQQWLQALDDLPDPVLLHDEQGLILRVNRAYAERVGAPFQQILERPYWEIFPRQEGPLQACGAIARGEDYIAEDLVLPDGQVFRSLAYAVRDTHNGRRFGFHIFRDHTEQVRQRRQKEESESFFSALAEAARDPVLVMDAEGRVSYCNRAAEQTFGYASDEVLGRPLHHLLAPERYRGDYEAGLRHFARTGEGPVVGKTLEVEARRKDGETFPVEISVSSVQLEDGWYALGILRDISERKAQEHHLRRTNWALSALSRANSALVHAEDEATLFQEVCRALTDDHAYPLAWVGLADDAPEHRIRQAACAGQRTDYLEDIQITWDDEPTGRGPVGRAIRTGTTQVSRDIRGDPTFEPWRTPAEQRGLRSAVAIPLSNDGIVFGSLNVYASEPDAFDEQEQALLEQLAHDIAYGMVALRTRHERDHARQALRRALMDTVEAIARTVERRDPYTAGHQKRVAELARAIGQHLGMTEKRLEGLYLAGLMHDLGKISVPSEILNRPGRLSEKEFELIKDHPREGYAILEDVDFPWPLKQAILQHHERLDGSGYPDGLAGNAISLEARIVAVADIVEAMSSHRPYRPSPGLEAALALIEAERGTRLDASAVDACLALFREQGFVFPDVHVS